MFLPLVAGLVAQGYAHVLTIRETGGNVLGNRSLEADGLRPRLQLNATHGTHVYEGLTYVREATPEDRRTLDTASTWGFLYIQAIAETVFVKGERPSHLAKYL
jgi:hypothetical protein